MSKKTKHGNIMVLLVLIKTGVSLHLGAKDLKMQF